MPVGGCPAATKGLSVGPDSWGDSIGLGFPRGCRRSSSREFCSQALTCLVGGLSGESPEKTRPGLSSPAPASCPAGWEALAQGPAPACWAGWAGTRASGAVPRAGPRQGGSGAVGGGVADRGREPAGHRLPYSRWASATTLTAGLAQGGHTCSLNRPARGSLSGARSLRRGLCRARGQARPGRSRMPRPWMGRGLSLAGPSPVDSARRREQLPSV